MCLVIVVLAVGLAVSDILIKRKTTKDARQIVVASAAFDKFGRVLVKLNGSLPFQVIETDVVVKVSAPVVRLFSGLILFFHPSDYARRARPSPTRLSVALLPLFRLDYHHHLPPPHRSVHPRPAREPEAQANRLFLRNSHTQEQIPLRSKRNSISSS